MMSMSCVVCLRRVNRREADRSYGLMYLMIALGSVLFVLLMVPSIIEPPVLYIGVIFSLLSIIFIIGFMNSYLKHKSGDTFVERSGETLGGHLSSDSHHITEAVTVDANDGLTYNGSQVSTASSDLPPKYELPPSYEQSIYSINI